MFSKFEYDGKLNPTFKEGPFELPLSTIRAYIQDPVTPRSGLVSYSLQDKKLFTLNSEVKLCYLRLQVCSCWLCGSNPTRETWFGSNQTTSSREIKQGAWFHPHLQAQGSFLYTLFLAEKLIFTKLLWTGRGSDTWKWDTICDSTAMCFNRRACRSWSHFRSRRQHYGNFISFFCCYHNLFNLNITTNLGFLYYIGEGIERRSSTYMHRCFRKPACSQQDIRG